jgi:hypothetical protein
MRAIGIDDYLAITGIPRGSFDAWQARGEIALAFGLARRLAGGTMLDLDCICHFIGEALAQRFTRKYAATGLVCGYSDEVLRAIGLADTTADAIFLAAAESGPDYALTRRHRMHFGATTLADLAASLAKHEQPVTLITLVNVTRILRDVRTRAAKHGHVWTAPFFPPPDHPLATKLMAVAKKERDAALQMFAQEQLAKSVSEARQ